MVRPTQQRATLLGQARHCFPNGFLPMEPCVRAACWVAGLAESRAPLMFVQRGPVMFNGEVLQRASMPVAGLNSQLWKCDKPWSP